MTTQQIINSTEEKDISKKKVFIFDVDGTLTESKANITPKMASLVCALLAMRKVALLGGGNYKQLRLQCADKLPCLQGKPSVQNLLLSPVSGGALYTYTNNDWQNLYNLSFTTDESHEILQALKKSLADINYIYPETLYGEMIEDRGAQITFSALGQEASVDKKREWNKAEDVRPQIREALRKYIPNLSIRIGGTTSVDISKVDKAYGVEQIIKHFQVPIQDALFIGDGLQEGGNDHDVLKTGIDAIQVADHKQTQTILISLTTKK